MVVKSKPERESRSPHSASIDTTSPSASSSDRFEALDSLRGICACLVVLFHFTGNGWIAANSLIGNGGKFVDFFFVLSGFVIAASYGERLRQGYPLGRFLFLRLGRIYPLHVFVLAIFVLLELAGLAFPLLIERAAFSGSRSLSALPENLLLLQTFDLTSGLTWNAPAWSIAAEWWAYLLFGLALSWGRKRALLVVAVITLASAAWLATTPGFLIHASDWGCVTGFYGFGAGVLGWYAYSAFGLGCQAGWARGTAVEIAVALLVILAATQLTLPMTMLLPLVFVAAVIIFANESGILSRLLRTSPMKWLGTLSYSIYLIHVLVQGRLLDVVRFAGSRWGLDWVAQQPNGAKTLVAPPLVTDALTVLMLVLVIAAAALTYRFVEAPARTWSRSRAGIPRVSTTPRAISRT